MWPNLCRSISRRGVLSTTGLALGASVLCLSPITRECDCCGPTGAPASHSAPAKSWETGAQAALRDSAFPQTSSAVSNPLPTDRLSCKRGAHQHGRPYQPVVLLSCGSFNPPTVAHLRMFELAAHALGKGKELMRTTKGCSHHTHARSGSDMLGGYMAGYDMLGGYMSPVNDAYQKKGLAPAQQRVEMCKLAAKSSDIVMVDSWEAQQPTYQRSLKVLQRVKSVLHEYSSETDSASLSAGSEQADSSTEVRVMLLCGADMVESLVLPGVWQPEHVQTILRDYGVVCISRELSDVKQVMDDPASALHQHRANIILVEDPVVNNISSTVVRQEISQGRSIRYLVPDAVIDYIQDNLLYSTPSAA